MRLIDADKLITLIQEEKIEGKTLDIIKALGDGLQAETLNQACDKHIKIINSLPTIDAVAPKKGKWIPIDSFSAYGGDEETWEAQGNPVAFYYCSECKEQNYLDECGDFLLTNYCPNCGADMRG